jgi:hypothetical protein
VPNDEALVETVPSLQAASENVKQATAARSSTAKAKRPSDERRILADFSGTLNGGEISQTERVSSIQRTWVWSQSFSSWQEK